MTKTLEAADFILYAGVRTADQQPVVLKVLTTQRPRPEQLDLLQREADIGNAVRASVNEKLAVGSYEGKPALVLEGFGGVPLDRQVVGPMPTADFLRLAIRITDALATVHDAGIVHKDVKPQNILIDPRTREVRMTEFGLSARLSLEPASAERPPRLEGSLPYIAPEQTGRIHCRVDARADLYSLGVTLFQLLTGRLPFFANDPMAWVYCHIARSPPSPASIVPSVPTAVADIVLKLLAKTPDGRYQKARGLRLDLERCLSEWELRGAVEPFQLGERDLPDSPQPPRALHGRETETAELARALARVTASGEPELVLLVGPAGVGKSALAPPLHQAVARARGTFLFSKLDQFRHDVPYAAIADPFRERVRELLTESEERIAARRRELRTALAPNARALFGVVPELEFVLGPCEPLPELSSTDAARRFAETFRRFLTSWTAQGEPLVLFLDDLQWVDPASASLIGQVLAGARIRHLLVVGAYREAEVDASHPLTRVLDELGSAEAKVTRIVVSPLPPAAIEQLVADALVCPPSEFTVVEPLAQLVHEKTAGNPFFALQFLLRSRQLGLLVRDRNARWTYDLDAIRAQAWTDNVVDLIVQRLHELPPAARELLAIGACLGRAWHPRTLARVSKMSESDVERELMRAANERLVVADGANYHFTHDRIQQAAHAGIPSARLPGIHLEIGRALYTDTPAEERPSRIFEIVAAYDVGVACVTDPAEKQFVTELNLAAGRHAKSTTAYEAAASYLAVGISLLDDDAWQRTYATTYALYMLRAECEFSRGNFAVTKALLATVIREGRSVIDKSAAYRLRLDLEGAAGDSSSAFETGVACLRLFGIEVPAEPTAEDLRVELEQVRRELGDRSPETLVDLPLLSNVEVEAAVKTLVALLPSAYWTDARRHFFVACRTAALTIRYGASSTGIMGLCALGLELVDSRKEREGFAFGRAALDLADKYRFVAVKSELTNLFYAAIAPWSLPLDEVIARVREAYGLAVSSGNLACAGYAGSQFLNAMFTRGVPLGVVEREVNAFLELTTKSGLWMAVDLGETVARIVRELRGAVALVEEPFRRHTAKEIPIVTWRHWSRRVESCFFFGDYRGALDAAAKARARSDSARTQLATHDCSFFEALTLAVAPPAALGDEANTRDERLAAIREWLRERSEAAPTNFLASYYLVAAEIARLANDESATELYERARSSAYENGLVHYEALACELTARHYREQGASFIADAYLREARAAYALWGADAKVQQLEALNPRVFERPTPDGHAIIGASGGPIGFVSVLEAWRTIARETGFDQVVRRVLHAAVEQGDAQRGRLFVLRGGELQLEGDAEREGDATRIHRFEPARRPFPTDAPLAVVEHVVHARQTFVLRDAADGFPVDPYLVERRPLSLICLPILNQAALVGVLYLENARVLGCFTHRRVEALELLASQAAVSLVNASLLERERRARANAEAAESRAAFLAEVSRLLATSLDERHLLASLARLVTQSATALADWCVIDLVEDGRLVPGAAAHHDPTKERLFDELRARYPLGNGQPEAARGVVETREALLATELTEESLRAECADPKQVDLLRELGTRSALVVPLVARDKVLGVLGMVSQRRGQYVTSDIQLASDLGRRAAVGIDNARLYGSARAAGHARDQMLATVATELNTPFSSLTRSLETVRTCIKQPSSDAATLDEPVGRMKQDCERLSVIVGHILDVSRIQSNALALRIEEDVDLAWTLREHVTRAAPDFARAGCEVSLSAPDELVASFDTARIEQVIAKLLSNSMKVGRGHPITIELVANDDTVRFSVTTRGVGLSPSQQRELEATQPSVTTFAEGDLGLDFYISRAIVKAHEGTLRTESRPGTSTSFLVELPRVRSAGPSAIPSEAS